MTTGDNPTITRVELCRRQASARSTWTVIRVDAGAGLTGCGECSDSGDAATLEAAVLAARAALVGRPVEADHDDLRAWLRHQRSAADHTGGFAWSTALGGIESALADLVARHRDESLAVHLGSSVPERVRLYANLNRTWGAHGLDQLVAAASAAAAEGFPAVKIAPFDAVGGRVGEAAADVARGLTAVDAVRSALPSDVEIMIDCHQRLDDHALALVLPELAARRVFWVEDAVSPRDLDRLCRLRDRTPVPLALGEHEWDPGVVEAACATGAVDFWLIDPKHAGGPLATRRLVEATGEAMVSYHNPSGPIGTLHAAHLSRLSPRIGWLEYAWGEPDRAGYLTPAEKVDNGALVVPDGPGIRAGLATDEPESVEEP